MGDCCSALQTEDPGQILRGNFPLQTLHDSQLRVHRDELIGKGVPVQRLRGDGGCSECALRLSEDLTRLALDPCNRSDDKYVLVADIVEVREAMSGEELPNADLIARMHADRAVFFGRTIAIIYRGRATRSGRNFRSLCVAFRDSDTANSVAQCVGALAARARDEYLRDPTESRVKELWGRADKNRDEKLSRGEISQLLQTLNIQLTRYNLQEKFEAADNDHSRYLEYEEFRWFFSQLRRRKEVGSIFAKYAGGPRPGQRLPFDKARIHQEVFLRPPRELVISGDTAQAVIVELADGGPGSAHTVRWCGSGSVSPRGRLVTEVTREWWDGDGSAAQADWPMRVVNGRRQSERWAGAYFLHRRFPPDDGRGRVWRKVWQEDDGSDRVLELFRGSGGSWVVAASADDPPLLEADGGDSSPAPSWVSRTGRRWVRREGGRLVVDECLSVEDAISASGFREYLERCQNDFVDLSVADETLGLVTGCMPSRRPDQHAISQEQFTNFLFNPAQNGWFKPHHRARVYQPMDRPLNDYFINSSHNTYLTGDQLKSRSSAEMYKICLEKGCRCVELDCWNGDAEWNREPVIYHGHTRTTKVSFRSVCQVINKYAFTTTEYPVILSLEVHTDREQQKRMVEIMQRQFGERLLPMPLDCMRNGPADCGDDGAGRRLLKVAGLPFTPKGLRGRVLVKCQVHPDYAKRGGGPVRPSGSHEPFGGSETLPSGLPQGMRSPRSFGEGSAESGTDVDEDDDDDSEPAAPTLASVPTEATQPRHRKTKITKDLSEVVFLKGRKLKLSCDKRAELLQHEICSYNDSAFQRLVHEVGKEVVLDANRRMFSRVYPTGTRVWSDNPYPVPAWNMGVQMVALNFQKLDFPMRLNEAKFEANGGCGYLLKPALLRLPPEEQGREPAPCTLRVKVISGSQIPKPNLSEVGGMVDPYVCVLISGLPEDSTKEPAKTRVIPGNGFDPLWNEDFEFKIRSVELAMLTLRVVDNDTTGIDYTIAEASIPLTSLRCGYRCVPLRNYHDNVELDHACLFCHFLLTRQPRD